MFIQISMYRAFRKNSELSVNKNSV